MKVAVVLFGTFILLAIIGLGWYFLQPSVTDGKTLFVGPTRGLCRGEGWYLCLQVKQDPESEWENYFGEIEGFEHEVGYAYELLVRIEEVENPLADGSNQRLVLEQEIAKEAVPFVAISDPVFGDVVDVSKPLVVSGVGRGLFENNVVVQVGSEREIAAEEPTVMETEEVGGEGVWSVEMGVELGGEIEGIISAYSPSARDGDDEMRFSIWVRFGEESATDSAEVMMEESTDSAQLE